MKSLSRHVHDIVRENIIINTDIIEFTQTQTDSSDSAWQIIELLMFFNIKFINNENKSLDLDWKCRNDIAVFDKFDANGVSVLCFKKNAFAGTLFTLILVYRKQSMLIDEFVQMLQYLRATNSIDITAGDFKLISFKSVGK